jgi:hypothetical protein
MMIGKGEWNGRPVLMVGLSFGNLDNFRKGPLDSFITIRGEQLGLDHDIIIFSGETEDQLAEYAAKNLAPDGRFRLPVPKGKPH